MRYILDISSESQNNTLMVLSKKAVS